MGKNVSVFGIYPSQAAVEEAVHNLRSAGFRNTDISVLLPENLGSKDLGHEKHTKAPEGATTGAASGAVIGGALGWLAGIGALAIPGIGPFIAAGPIIGMLAGIGAGGAAGGMVGALIGAGIPEYEAKRYEGRIRKGGILLSVHCDDSEWAKRAQVILEQTGGEDISKTAQSRADFAESDKPLPRQLTPIGAEPENRTTTRTPRTTRRANSSPTSVPIPVAADPAPLVSSAWNLRAGDVMTGNVELIDAGRPISEAAERMRSAGIGFLPVREGGRIVGVVTDRDITVRGAAAGYDPRTTAVASVMTSEYAYCLEDDSITEVERIMREKQLKRVMVLDSQRNLAGVISMGDIEVLLRASEPDTSTIRR